MSNARFSILQARAVTDKRVSDAQFRTLAALGMYADKDGWCYPMLSTLGTDLGKSKQAVGRDTIALRRLGYLEVTARFDEHGARRSNLYRLRFDLDTPRQRDVDTPSTSLVDTPSTSEVDVNVPINDPLNHDDVRRAEFAEIARAYESEIGALTAMIADELQDAADTYPKQWILDAIHESAVQNKRGWKYCLAILKRWKAQGNQNPLPGTQKPTNGPQKPATGQGRASEPRAADAIRNWLGKEGAESV